MAYNKTSWADKIVQNPLTYDVQNNPDDSITLTPNPGTITQAGTPVNAANLNKIEQGIYDADLYGADAGGDDTYVLNLSTTLATGLKVRLKVSTGNTGAATLSIDNGTTTKTIRKMTSAGLTDLVTGDIKAGQIIELAYDGTYWQLLGAYVLNAENADTVDNKHYNQMAYEVFRGETGTIQYEAGNIVANNTEASASVVSGNWIDIGKDLTINCDACNFVKVDYEIKVDTGSTGRPLQIRLKDDATGDTYAAYSNGNWSNPDTWYWVTAYTDLSALSGTRTFSVEMYYSYSAGVSYTVRNRGLDIHNNKVRQVRWS